MFNLHGTKRLHVDVFVGRENINVDSYTLMLRHDTEYMDANIKSDIETMNINGAMFSITSWKWMFVAGYIVKYKRYQR